MTPPTPTIELELDKILGRHSVHYNYSKVETREQLSLLITKAEQSARFEQVKEMVENTLSDEEQAWDGKEFMYGYIDLDTRDINELLAQLNATTQEDKET